MCQFTNTELTDYQKAEILTGFANMVRGWRPFLATVSRQETNFDETQNFRLYKNMRGPGRAEARGEGDPVAWLRTKELLSLYIIK